MPVANQIETQNIGGKTYYKGDDGQFYDSRGVPLEQAPQDYSGGSQFEQGVTATDPISGYVSNYNPLQYATAGTTQQLGSEFGLPTGETHMEFSDASAPQRTVGGLNAGLVQDTINRYGPATPGSLSEYLIKRDLPGNQGQQDFASYNSYYNSAPVKAAVAQSQTAPGATKSLATPPPPPPDYAPYGFGNTDPTGDARRAAATTAWQKSQSTPSTGGGGRINTSGLKVVKDANNSYSGTIQINGKPARIAILPDGRVFDDTGKDISSTFSPDELKSLTGAFGTAANDPGYKPGAQQTNQTPGTTNTPATPGDTRTPPPYHDPPFQRTPVQGPGIPGATGPSQAPNAGYTPRATPASFANTPNPTVFPTYRTNGQDVDKQAQEDRNLALQRGEQLNSDLTNYTNDQYAQAGDFSDLQGAAYSGIANGQGGYSGDEKNAILRQDELNSLQLTPEEANQNYLSTDEQKGIMGDTGAAYHQLGIDEAGVDLASNNRDQYARGEFNAGRDAVNNSLNAQDAGVRGAYGSQAATTRATVVGEANNARKYLDPNALNTSAEYNSAYNFGDRDMQDIEDKAGRTVGYGAAADEDRLLQDANASGNTSPLALAAARNRIRQQGQVGSADAITDARIQAKQLQLQTAQNKENTRLGAAQNYANLGTGTELNLGQDALANEQSLGAAQIGAESYLGNQRTQAQQALGQQGTQLEKDLGQSHIDIGTTGAQMNLAAGQAKDAANSARAGQVATNRQATSQANQATQYNRGKSAYDTESAANTNFANQRLSQEQEYRKTLADRQAQAAQAAQVGNSQKVGAYGAQSGAVNAATGNSVSNAKTSDPTSIGGILGGLGLKRGGVTPGPHTALVGEAGPELVINLPQIRQDEYGEYPSYAEGGVIPGSDIQQADDQYITPVSQQAQDLGYQPRKNPLYEQILKQAYGVAFDPSNPYSQGGGSQNPNGALSGLGGKVIGGLVGKGLGALGLARGGVVGGDQPLDSYVAPGVELVDGPQLKQLGTHGADAVLPLVPRKGNRVTPGMIPRLAEEYGSYAR